MIEGRRTERATLGDFITNLHWECLLYNHKDGPVMSVITRCRVGVASGCAASSQPRKLPGLHNDELAESLLSLGGSLPVLN